MSISVIEQVFSSEALAPTERLIMLALADHADDDGRCYPSIARLCQRTGLSERAMQSNIRKLCDAGYLVVVPGGGRSRQNLYVVTPNPAADAPFTQENPAPNAPFVDVNPAGETPFLVQNPAYGALNPASPALNPAADAPKPSRTVIEPEEKIKDARSEIISAVGVDDPDFDAAVVSFCAYRRKSKAKALTVTAAKRLGQNLRAILDGGGSPADALGMAEERGWQTIKPDWYFREQQNGNGSFGTAGGGRSQAGYASPGRDGQGASIASYIAGRRLRGQPPVS